MKSCCVLTLQAILACVCAAVCASGQTPAFNTGQAAHLVIGQVNFTAGNYGASNTLLGSPSGIAYANGVLWVVDSNRLGSTPDNNRVLRFSDVSSYPSLTDLPDIPGSTCGVCRGTASLVLGQPDFNTFTPSLSGSGLRNPTSVATDGKVLAVADTDNNRVLIWLNLPTVNGQPADVVVGQPNFTSNAAQSPSQTSLRAPSGVWIYNGKLYVADTYDDRVLIYNKIPTTNNAPADLVLGQSSFTAFVQPDLAQAQSATSPSNMQTPVSVSTDGTRLFVSDLGQNRVLMWNTIPTTNGAPADYALGQPNLTGNISNNTVTVNSTAVDADGNPTSVTPVLCQSNGTDVTTGTTTYPARCAATLSFPRFAYSDGKRLFVADGGNDRVLIFNSFPTKSGQRADIILGQPDEFSDNTGDNPSGTNAFENPSAVAFDGTNLYVTDTYNRRVLVHTPGIANIPLNGVNNAASLAIYAIGKITFTGSITAGNTITITITLNSAAGSATGTTSVNTASYEHTMVSADTTSTVLTDLINKINKTDPNVTATADLSTVEIVLTAKTPGAPGGLISYSVASSSGATFLGTTTASTLNIYLENPAQIAPGTLIQIIGTDLCDTTGSADFSQTYLPFTMNNCILYVDGIRAPLLYVSPTQINAQMPWDFSDRTSISLYLRTTHSDGSVTATTPIATTIPPQNPGLFALGGNDPRPGILYHASSFAFDIVDLDGIPQAGDTAILQIGANATSMAGTCAATIGSNAITGSGTAWTTAMAGGAFVVMGDYFTVASVSSATSLTLNQPFEGTTGSWPCTIYYGSPFYTYTETASDTIATTTANLVAAINAGPDPNVYAVLSNEYNRMILYANVAGPAGEGIPVIGNTGTTAANNAIGSNLTVSAYSATTCCDAPAGLPVTVDNPAISGEALYTFTTGLGPTNPANIDTGFIYRGGNNNPPAVFVDSILAGGLTATAIDVALVPGTAGIYYVEFALNDSMTADIATQLTIAQQLFVSNVVTFPLLLPGQIFINLPPTVSSVGPATGPITGGNTVTITGTNFTGVDDVQFGGLAASSYTVNSATSISAVVPAATATGPVSVVVTNAGGSNQANTLYTYATVPSITSINPSSGPIAGGNKITITGVGFTGTASVTFAQVPVNFTVNSDTTITVIAPAAFEAGTAQVIVSAPGGAATGTYVYSATANALDISRRLLR